MANNINIGVINRYEHSFAIPIIRSSIRAMNYGLLEFTSEGFTPNDLREYRLSLLLLEGRSPIDDRYTLDLGQRVIDYSVPIWYVSTGDVHHDDLLSGRNGIEVFHVLTEGGAIFRRLESLCKK